MDATTERRDRKYAAVAFAILLVIGYTIASAGCATSGSCTFASANWFNWIATHTQIITGIIGATFGAVILGKILGMPTVAIVASVVISSITATVLIQAFLL
jgi:hypothetical protein